MIQKQCDKFKECEKYGSYEYECLLDDERRLEVIMTNIVFKPVYIDLVCLTILLFIFFIALFLTNGITFLIDVILLAGTAALFGRTVGNMH